MGCKPREITESMSLDRINHGTYLLETTANVVGITDENGKFYVNFAGSPSGGVNRVWLLEIKEVSYLVFANKEIERFVFMVDGEKPDRFKFEQI